MKNKAWVASDMGGVNIQDIAFSARVVEQQSALRSMGWCCGRIMEEHWAKVEARDTRKPFDGIPSRKRYSLRHSWVHSRNRPTHCSDTKPIFIYSVYTA